MIIAVSSWRGLGASTIAMALASVASREGDAWLVEADPAGGVLAGRLNLGRATVGGLERVAFPTQACSMVEAFHEVAHDHGGVRIVSAPLDPFRAMACHRPRADWIGGLGDLDGTVVVDAGRLRAGSAGWPVLCAADTVVCVAAAEVSAAVATAEWLRVAGRVGPNERGLDDTTVKVAVVASPSSAAFTRQTLQSDFGPAYAGWIPWDPVGVDLLHRGADVAQRRVQRRPLFVGAIQLFDGLRTATPVGVQ